MYLMAGLHGSWVFTGQIQIGRPLRLAIYVNFLLPGTAQTSFRRLGPVSPEFDALFAAARMWDTLTSVSLPLP